MNHDLRLIEDYEPIAAISAESSREKSVRKEHVSTLHLRLARRPLIGRKPSEVRPKNPHFDPAEQFVHAQRRTVVAAMRCHPTNAISETATR